MKEQNHSQPLSATKRLPPWLRQPLKNTEQVLALKKSLKARHLHTVCQSAGCPNIAECFKRPTAAFMILGDRCTRHCRFCGVDKGNPDPLDPDEPRRVAEMASILELKHVVITSVTRDDLDDGGAAHFNRTIRAIRRQLPGASIEALIPDFRGDQDCLDTVMSAGPDVLNHNVETVPRLYAEVRPEADFTRSLAVLHYVYSTYPGTMVKSGIMTGLGEQEDELRYVFRALLDAGCSALTIGQYLSPSRHHYPVKKYVHPDRFKEYHNDASAMGFQWVSAGPNVRSSYHADDMVTTRKGVTK